MNPERHLLIFSHHSSEPGVGNHDKHFRLGCELVKRGWKVTIVAASDHHWLNHPVDLEGKPRRVSTNAGVRFIYLSSSRYRGNGIGRALGLFRVAWKAARIPDDLLHGATHVMASMPDPFMALPAWFHRKRNPSVKLLVEIRDLWSGYLTPYIGMSRFHPFAFAVRRAERFAVKSSDAVVSSLPRIHLYLQELGLVRPIHILPFGITSAAPIPPHLPDGIWPRKLEGRFVIGYAGGLIRHNLLEPLLQAAAELREDPRFGFILFGTGSQEHELRAMVQSLALDNVHLAGRIPKEMVPSALGMMDLLYKGTPSIDVNRFGTSPIKMNEYMASGKPIVHLSSKHTDTVEEIGCGMRLDVERAHELPGLLREIHAIPLQRREEMGSLGRRWVQENLTMGKVAGDFDDFLRGLPT